MQSEPHCIPEHLLADGCGRHDQRRRYGWTGEPANGGGRQKVHQPPDAVVGLFMNVLFASTGLMLMMTGLFGADNVLTARERAEGWVLLFDGESLNGWSSAIPAAGGQAGGAARGGAQKQPKAPANSAAVPAVGSHPRTCSTPLGQATADAR